MVFFVLSRWLHHVTATLGQVCLGALSTLPGRFVSRSYSVQDCFAGLAMDDDGSCCRDASACSSSSSKWWPILCQRSAAQAMGWVL